MSVVKCRLCNRPLKNMSKATSYEGGFVGPTCLKNAKISSEKALKREEEKEPDYGASIKNLTLSAEDYQDLKKKMRENKALRDLMGSGLETDEMDRLRKENGKEILELESELWRVLRNLPSDPWASKLLATPIHPSSLKSVDIDAIKVVEPLRQKFKKGFDPNDNHKFKKVDNNNILLAVHSFCKLFNDPSLPKKDYELFEKLELRLLAVAPTAGGLTTFIVTSDSSKYSERGLAIHVFDNGWINFKCVEISDKGIKASMTSDKSCYPVTFRRDGKGGGFDKVRALVASIFLVDRPEHTDVFKQLFSTWNWNAIYRDDAFTFRS